MTQAQGEWHFCPFAHPLMIRQFQCQQANEVTRRDGPAIACQNADAQVTCQSLFDYILAATLAAQGLNHDLTQIPSSLLKKIQVASILALQNLQPSTGAVPEKASTSGQVDTTGVESIYAVVQAAKAEHESWSSLALQPIIQYIESFQLQRRRNSQKNR